MAAGAAALPPAPAAARAAGTRNTLADWTAEGDDNDYYPGEKRQRGGRKKRKKNKEPTTVAQNWDDIYDPSRPNNYEDYKNSDEKIAEIREWKDLLYAHRMARRASSRSDSDSDTAHRPQLNSKSGHTSNSIMTSEPPWQVVSLRLHLLHHLRISTTSPQDLFLLHPLHRHRRLNPSMFLMMPLVKVHSKGGSVCQKWRTSLRAHLIRLRLRLRHQSSCCHLPHPSTLLDHRPQHRQFPERRFATTCRRRLQKYPPRKPSSSPHSLPRRLPRTTTLI